MESFRFAKIETKPKTINNGLISLFNIKIIKINIENYISSFIKYDDISKDFKLLRSKHILLGFKNQATYYFFTNSIFRNMIYSITRATTYLRCKITLINSSSISMLHDIKLNGLIISDIIDRYKTYSTEELQYFASNVFKYITINSNIKNIKCKYNETTRLFRNFESISSFVNNHVKNIDIQNHVFTSIQCLNLKYLTCRQITKKLYAPRLTHLLCGQVYTKINFNNFTCLRILSLSHTDLYVPNTTNDIGITINIPTLTKLYIGYLNICKHNLRILDDLGKNNINKIICNNLEIIKIYNTRINELSINSVLKLTLMGNYIKTLSICSSDDVIITRCDFKTISIYKYNDVAISQSTSIDIIFNEIDKDDLSGRDIHLVHSVLSRFICKSNVKKLNINKCVLNEIILTGVINDCIINRNNIESIISKSSNSIHISNNSTYADPLSIRERIPNNIYNILKRHYTQNNDILTINIENINICVIMCNYGNLDININEVTTFKWICTITASYNANDNFIYTSNKVINIRMSNINTLQLVWYHVEYLTIVFKTSFDTIKFISSNSYAIIDDNISIDNIINTLYIYKDAAIETIKLNKYKHLQLLKVCKCLNLEHIYYHDNIYNLYYINIPCLTVITCEKLFQYCRYLDNYQLKKLIIKDNNHIHLLNCPNLEVLKITNCNNIFKLIIPNIRKLSVCSNVKLEHINKNKLVNLLLLKCKSLCYIYGLDIIDTTKIVDCPNLKK